MHIHTRIHRHIHKVHYETNARLKHLHTVSWEVGGCTTTYMMQGATWHTQTWGPFLAASAQEIAAT